MTNPLDKNMIVPTKIKKEGIRFFGVDEKPFSIHGVWRTGDRYYRLPYEVAVNVNQVVKTKCMQTTGGRVRFKTNSSYVAVKLTLHSVEQISIMPVVATAGLDIYEGDMYLGSFVPPFHQSNGDFESIVELGEARERDLTIHFPLYAGINDLYIGIDEGATLGEAEPYRFDLPVVFYGSSITNGGCCSRPGMSYEAQISRALNIDHHNLGFGGSAKAEPAIAEYVAGLDMLAFVYDYDHNAPTVEYLAETHERMFKTVREKNPDLPIIMVSRPQVLTIKQRDERFAIIKRTYDNAIAAGDKNVYLIPGWTFFDGVRNDYTVDGVHPTDLGFACMAHGIGEALKGVLGI